MTTANPSPGPPGGEALFLGRVFERVTDQAVPLIAVSRSGFDCEGLARCDAADLTRGWSG